MIWAVLMLEQWGRNFMDAGPAVPAPPSSDGSAPMVAPPG